MDFTEIARIFAEKGGVQNLHFHEGANIHDFQIENLYTNASLDGFVTACGKAAEPSDSRNPHDHLFYDLNQDMNLYVQVTDALGMCIKPADLGTYLRPLLKGKDGLLSKRYATKEFAAHLVPYLTNYKGSKSPRVLARHI